MTTEYTWKCKTSGCDKESASVYGADDMRNLLGNISTHHTRYGKAHDVRILRDGKEIERSDLPGPKPRNLGAGYRAPTRTADPTPALPVTAPAVDHPTSVAATPVLNEPIEAPTHVPEYESQNGEVEHMRAAIDSGLNALATGPTGCGKTHLVAWVAQDLKRPMVTIQGADGASPEYIIGYRELREENGVAVTRWVDGALPRAMRAGAILYVDEPNALPDGIRFYLFAAMDHRREISLAENACERVRAAPGFAVVAAMNEGAGYSGTSALNLAFRDRFDVTVDLEYLSPAKEAKLIASRTGVKKRTAQQMVDAAQRLRIAYTNKQIKTPISTRSLLAWGTLANKGMDLREAAKLTLIGKVPTTFPLERKAIQDAVDAVIASTGDAPKEE